LLSSSFNSNISYDSAEYLSRRLDVYERNINILVLIYSQSWGWVLLVSRSRSLPLMVECDSLQFVLAETNERRRRRIVLSDTQNSLQFLPRKVQLENWEFRSPVVWRPVLMDQSPINQNFYLNKSRQNSIIAWKSITKLVIFQNFVAKCCKMWVIYSFAKFAIFSHFWLRAWNGYHFSKILISTSLNKNFITAWKSITKLVIFQSFVAKCCKMRII
jgi:hypothetical protein